MSAPVQVRVTFPLHNLAPEVRAHVHAADPLARSLLAEHVGRESPRGIALQAVGESVKPTTSSQLAVFVGGDKGAALGGIFIRVVHYTPFSAAWYRVVGLSRTLGLSTAEVRR